MTQEIYVDFLARDRKRPYVDSGVWKIILAARNIKNGEYFLWLPGGKTLNPGTAFYLPRPQGTLTIPATARRVISVGAYDAQCFKKGANTLPGWMFQIDFHLIFVIFPKLHI